MTTTAEISPFAQVLRTYSYGYTATHDLDLTAQIMVEGYELRMGAFLLRGRDSEYRSAAERQFLQYPGMGFTVLDVVTNGDRAAMRFCEHGVNGRSRTGAAWTGIGLYEWDGSRLTSCRVEQDYLSRARQLAAGAGDAVPAPALDPWIAAAGAEEPATVEAVRRWLDREWLRDRAVVFDDEDRATAHRVELDGARTRVLDIFGAGDAVAFHVEVEGGVLAGPGLPESAIGRDATLYASGLVRLRDGIVVGHVVTDRFAFARRLADGAGA